MTHVYCIISLAVMATVWVAVIGAALALAGYYWNGSFHEKIQERTDPVYDYIIGRVRTSFTYSCCLVFMREARTSSSIRMFAV